MDASGIKIVGLTKRFDDVVAVNEIDLAAPAGAFLVLLGPSGCGKTTLLRMLAGLEAPSAGEICFGERLIARGDGGPMVPPGERNAGLVFQSYALWPHMTVRGNVEWPLKVARWPVERRQARADEVLSLLDILRLASRYPNEISGGEQQRVAIARMLAAKPSVLLFDEPLSNLDAKLRVEMRAELLRIHRATGATSVYVTHDQVEAMTMATHIAVMNRGRLEQFGAPQEVLDHPRTPFVATFVGTPPGNLIAPTISDDRFRYGTVDLGLANGKAAGKRCLLLYRPETLRVHVEPGTNRLAIEFAEATPVAGRAIVTGWYQGQRLTAVADRMPDARLGEPLYLEFPPAPAAVFNDAEERVS